MATMMEKAKVALILRHPFFGSLVMRHEAVECKSIPTACVNAKGQIKYNPDFVAKLSKDELVFVLAHEVMHVVYAHVARRQSRDPERWNVACDAVINEMLAKCKVGTLLDGVVRMPGADEMTAEQVYAMLEKQPPRHGDGEGGDGGKDDGHGYGPGVTGDVVMEDVPEEPEQSQAEITEQTVKGRLEIAQAAQAARMQGKLGSYLGGLIDKILDSRMPWYEILERYMVGKCEQYQTWNRPNKRFVGRFYLPRIEGMPSMGKIVIGIDTSGSIGDKEMGAFIGHMNRIIEQCRPEEVSVLYVTTNVEHVDTYTREEFPIPVTKNRWCGGTDMTAVVDWIKRNEDDVDVAIIFTDGYTPYPDSSPCDLLWVLTEKDSPRGSFGEFIQME